MDARDFYNIPRNNLVLLTGPPGSGKSTFCKGAVQDYLRGGQGLVVYLATESSPDAIVESLLEQGVTKAQLERLRIIDAYSATLADAPQSKYGVAVDGADCVDLSGMGAKITKMATAGGGDNLLVFDSLSAPYIFNGESAIKFLRMTLTKFALQGNRVLACMAEGCGKTEDLVAMQSISNGVIRIEPQEKKRVLDVLKFPKMGPSVVDYVLRGGIEPVTYNLQNPFTGQWFANVQNTLQGKPIRTTMPDRVNLIWYQLALWGGMLWDKRFPSLMYNFGRDVIYQVTQQLIPVVIQQDPKLKETKDTVGLVKGLIPMIQGVLLKLGGGDLYLVEQKTADDEIHVGWNESAICFAFPNVNSALCYLYSGSSVGVVKAATDFMEGQRSWDAVEYMCLGLGDSTCRARVTPAGSDSLTNYLEAADNLKIERVNERITEQMASYLLTGKPPVERRRAGEGMHVTYFQESITLPSLSSEVFRRALGMAGVNSGVKLAEYLHERGISPNESINQLGKFLSYANVGQVQFGERLRIIENAETAGLKSSLPICSFTTGFLNGFSTFAKGAKVHEDVCQSSGGPYCEWVFLH